MAKQRKPRLELVLTSDEKASIIACADYLGIAANEFVVRAAMKERMRLKIKLKRPQGELFNIKTDKQLKLKL